MSIKNIIALSPLQIVPSWVFFQIDQIPFFHVNVSRHELYLPSQTFSLHHKTQCPLHLYFPQSYYNRNQILNVLVCMVHIFAVITEEISTNDSHRGKKVSPILHVDGRIRFAFSSFLSKVSNIDLVLIFKYY